MFVNIQHGIPPETIAVPLCLALCDCMHTRNVKGITETNKEDEKLSAFTLDMPSILIGLGHTSPSLQIPSESQ